MWTLYTLRNFKCWSSGQDGSVDRNPSLPCTTKTRITTNLKTINNPKWQKIKLHGTPTTKELKKKLTRTRPVRQQTTQLPTQKNSSEAADLRGPGWVLSSIGCTGGSYLRGKLRADCGLWLGLLQREKLPGSHKSPLKSALEMRRWAALSPLWPLPHRQCHRGARKVPLPGEY